MTNDKHVGVVPSTRATKIKEPVTVVPIEVNYALEGKVWNFIDIWIGKDEDDLSIIPIMFLGETVIFKHLIIGADEDDLDTGPVVLNVIEVPPKIANLIFYPDISLYYPV